MIIIRTLRRDIAKYNMADEDLEESIEETGWKLVHGDVFRPPINNKLFAAVIGSGIQIFSMMAITIFFAMLGMLSPASRGALLTAAIFLFLHFANIKEFFLWLRGSGRANQPIPKPNLEYENRNRK